MNTNLTIKTGKTTSLPDWITPDLIAETIEVWQPKYEKRLTDQDAIEILLEVSALLDALGDRDDEAVFGIGTRVEP